MPKYCPDCWFSYDDPGDHKLKCKAKPCENRIISQAEPSDCPLQEVKIGHWIKMPLIEAGQTYSHKCSLCGRRILVTNAGLSEFPYCH